LVACGADARRLGWIKSHCQKPWALNAIFTRWRRACFHVTTATRSAHFGVRNWRARDGREPLEKTLLIAQQGTLRSNVKNTPSV